MTKNTFPRRIYCIDPAGLNLPVWSGADPITARAEPLRLGDSATVTAAAYESSKDVNGNSWLDYSDEEQVQHWGKQRFQWDELPTDVADALDAQRRAALAKEARFLRQANPALARRSAAGARLDELERELAR